MRKKTWKLWLFVAIAIVPTAILGILIDELVLEKLIGDDQIIELIIISVALLVYGVLFIVIERLNKNKKFKVTIGKPIPWQTFDKSKSPHEWAQFVKEHVYTL
jgi:undecaprenyl pyrophosphate phosphatase UppP